MSTLLRFRDLAITFTLVASAGACNQHDPARAADRAADRLNAKTEDLHDETKDFGEKARTSSKHLAAEAKDVTDRADDIGRASFDFERARGIRVESLRAEHAVIASQTALISTLAQAFPLVDGDRGNVAEKLQIFQMRVDEAGNAIQTLQSTEAKTWKERDDEASKAMTRLNDARQDAWEALDEAKRIDRTSMR